MAETTGRGSNLGTAGAEPQVFGQDSDNEVYELSPFTVDESDNKVTATQTLAVMRLNTNLKDIAASISVVTKDFLEDTQSTDLLNC